MNGKGVLLLLFAFFCTSANQIHENDVRKTIICIAAKGIIGKHTCSGQQQPNNIITFRYLLHILLMY